MPLFLVPSGDMPDKKYKVEKVTTSIGVSNKTARKILLLIFFVSVPDIHAA